MSEELNSNQQSTPVVSQSEPEVIALLKKIQQQLAFLEKKIDALVSSSQQKQFKETQFSKPYRSFRPSNRHDKRGYDDKPRERNFDQGSRFEKRHGDEERHFHHKKRPFFLKNKNREHR